MHQQDLFGGINNKAEIDRLDQRRRSRLTDPATSAAAEEHIHRKIGKLHKAVLAVADAIPRTARELAERACPPGAEVESYRKRVRELADRGLLWEVGAKRCLHTGRMAASYCGVAGTGGDR